MENKRFEDGVEVKIGKESRRRVGGGGGRGGVFGESQNLVCTRYYIK